MGGIALNGLNIHTVFQSLIPAPPLLSSISLLTHAEIRDDRDRDESFLEALSASDPCPDDDRPALTRPERCGLPEAIGATAVLQVARGTHRQDEITKIRRLALANMNIVPSRPIEPCSPPIVHLNSRDPGPTNNLGELTAGKGLGEDEVP